MPDPQQRMKSLSVVRTITLSTHVSIFEYISHSRFFVYFLQQRLIMITRMTFKMWIDPMLVPQKQHTITLFV